MAVATSDANSACVATARAALRIYTEERLAERSAKLSEYIYERLVREFLPISTDSYYSALKGVRAEESYDLYTRESVEYMKKIWQEKPNFPS